MLNRIVTVQECDPPSLHYGRAGATDDAPAKSGQAMKNRSWYQKK